MPIYEYVCEDCGNEFDIRRSFSEMEKEVECVNCRSTQTRKKLSRCYSKSEGGSSGSTKNCGSCSGGSCAHCH